MHATPARRVALLLFLFVRSTKIIVFSRYLGMGHETKRFENFKMIWHTELWS